MSSQKDRNEAMKRISQLTDKLLNIKNKRELTDQEKSKGIDEWLATPEGIEKMRTRYILSCMMVNNIGAVLYRLPGYKIFVAAYIALFGGLATWIFAGRKFIFIIGLIVLIVGQIEGLILGTMIVDDMYDKSLVKYALPDSAPEMVARYKATQKEFYEMDKFKNFSDEDIILRYGYGVFRYSGMTAEQAKKEYKNLVKLYHPDNSDNPCSSEILDNLKKEYETYIKYAKLVEELGYTVKVPCNSPQSYEDVELCI